MTHSVFGRSAFLVAAATAVSIVAACHKSGTMNTGASPASASGASTASSASSTSAAKLMSGGLPAGVTTQMVALGDSLFHARSCRNCHGMDAKGSRGGPDLTSGNFMHVSGSYDDFVKIITTGIPREEIQDTTHHNPMPPRGGSRPAPLTDDQIRDVAAYVYSLSHK